MPVLPRSTIQVLDNFEPRLLQRPERTSEDEEYARKLGFRPDY